MIQIFFQWPKLRFLWYLLTNSYFELWYVHTLSIILIIIINFTQGDSTDQEYEITADMMVHDLDDEATMDEEELLADKDEFNENELSELQKVTK